MRRPKFSSKYLIQHISQKLIPAVKEWEKSYQPPIIHLGRVLSVGDGIARVRHRGRGRHTQPTTNGCDQLCARCHQRMHVQLKLCEHVPAGLNLQPIQKCGWW